MPSITGFLQTANDTYTSGGTPVDLMSIVVGTGAASAVVTVYNGSAATAGTEVAIIDATAANYFEFGDEGAHFPKGLFVKLTAGNAKVTVVSQ